MNKKDMRARITDPFYTFPFPFYYYTSTNGYSFGEKDGKYEVSVELPGVKKEQVEVKWDGEAKTITVHVDGERVRSAYLYRDILSDKIEAAMDLGVLTITAPLANRTTTIKVK